MSTRQACVSIHMSLLMYYYRFKRKDDDMVIIKSLDGLADSLPTYCFKKMCHLLRSEGHLWNLKRVYLVCKLMALNLQRKRRRRLPARVKTPHILPFESNITWSMNFMHDTLMSGQQYRTFNVIDDHNREAMMIDMDTSLSARRITNQHDRLIEWRGVPEVVKVDNGPEFTSALFEIWARKHNIKICFIQPGKPTQNSLIERFNGNMRRELLNANLFTSLNQAREEALRWMWTYKNITHNASLNNHTPFQWNELRTSKKAESLKIDWITQKEIIFNTNPL